MPWGFNPHSGGTKIPEAVRDRTRRRILAYAEKQYSGRYTSLDVRFRGALCHIDAYVEPDVPEGWPPKDWGETREEMIERLRQTPVHLVRLRHFGMDDRWSLAYYTYSNDRYEPCLFRSGEFIGTPEEALDVGSSHLCIDPAPRQGDADD